MADATNTISIIALESKNLDTTCYRGSAPLAELTRMSQVDVYDQVTNPEGLQRDLSKKHAAEAYNYVARDADTDRPRAFPEVVLNVRDRKVIQRETLHEDNGTRVVKLTIDLDKIDAAKTVKISRVDGSHRLLYGAGDGKDREPVELPCPFQLHIGLTREQEISLFTDINAEQKGLNTSHLEILRSRITPEEEELANHPARAFARRLESDEASPWHNLVHLGGSKAGSKEAGAYRPINFVALENGVKRILRKSQYIHDLATPEAQYGLIRNYWQAVRAVFPEAWDRPRDYLIAKNIGVNAFSELGATILDRCMAAGNVEIDHMVPYLLDAKKKVNWHKDSPEVAGMSGNRAVLVLAGHMANAFGTKKATRALDPAQVEAEQRALYAEPEPADSEADESEQAELPVEAAA